MNFNSILRKWFWYKLDPVGCHVPFGFSVGYITKIIYCWLSHLFLILLSLFEYLEREVELYLLQAGRDGVEVVGEEFLWIVIAFKKILKLPYMVFTLYRSNILYDIVIGIVLCNNKDRKGHYITARLSGFV